MIGLQYVPPKLPIFDILYVILDCLAPSSKPKSSRLSFPSIALSRKRRNSFAISKIESLCTLRMYGTTRPLTMVRSSSKVRDSQHRLAAAMCVPIQYSYNETISSQSPALYLGESMAMPMLCSACSTISVRQGLKLEFI